MKVNGVENPCSKCGRATTDKYWIMCDELNYTHGHKCHCELTIGTNCLKKMLKKKPDLKYGKRVTR